LVDERTSYFPSTHEQGTQAILMSICACIHRRYLDLQLVDGTPPTHPLGANEALRTPTLPQAIKVHFWHARGGLSQPRYLRGGCRHGPTKGVCSTGVASAEFGVGGSRVPWTSWLLSPVYQGLWIHRIALLSSSSQGGLQVVHRGRCNFPRTTIGVNDGVVL
jgi:hypothetical protein